MPDFTAVQKFLTKPFPALDGPTFPRRQYTPDFDRRELNALWQPMTPFVAIHLPVVNIDCFVARFDDHSPHADTLLATAAGHAYANIIMALGSSFKCLNEAFPVLGPRIWPWFMNALAALAELAITGTDALAVQAVVGMAIFLQGTGSSSIAVALMTSAAAMSNRLGLHRGGGGHEDGHVRDRVFWAAYILDKSAALYHGVPPAIPDDDVEVKLPLPDIFWLRLRAQLATVESRVYATLYTGRALALPGPSVFRAILDADKMMDGWRRALPENMVDAIVEGAIAGDDDSELTGSQLDVVLTFNTCQLLVHWARGRLGAGQTVTVTMGGDEELRLDGAKHCLLRCRSAATAVMTAFCSVSAPQYAFLWRTICHPLCAMFVLLVDILGAPEVARTTKLLQTAESFTTFLETFQREEKCDLSRMTLACGTMLQIAQAVVQSFHEGTDFVAPKSTHGVTPEVSVYLLWCTYW